MKLNERETAFIVRIARSLKHEHRDKEAIDLLRRASIYGETDTSLWTALDKPSPTDL